MWTIRWQRVLPVAVTLVLGAGGLAACGDGAAQAVEQVAEADDIDADAAALARTLRANDMETLASAVEAVDIGDVIGDGEFTLFGPNDEAFLALGAEEIADLLAAPEELQDVLRSHAVTERLDAETLSGRDSITTRAGTTLEVKIDGDMLVVGGATVVDADIDAGDGVVHVIDGVIMP